MKKKYTKNDKLTDLIHDNYSILLVMSRFGIRLGVGERSIREVCQEHGVDAFTFLTIVNFLVTEEPVPETDLKKLSIETLISYLHLAHEYFLSFKLPQIKVKLKEAISDCPEEDVKFVILNFFDEYVKEVGKHMTYEEKKVFPYVRNLLAGKTDSNYKISIFAKQHDDIEMKITDLKNILIKYYPGEGGNILNSVLFDIFATEQDLAAHNSVEDHIFVPAIKLLEQKTGTR